MFFPYVFCVHKSELKKNVKHNKTKNSLKYTHTHRKKTSYYFVKTNFYHQSCLKRTTLIPGEDGVKCSIWQMCFGVAGNENIFLRCRSARNAFDREETSLLETRLSLMNRRPGTCGRLVESQKCSQIEMVSCVA